MATISSPGVGSGLDVNSIVTQLVALERRPISQLQKEASSLQTKLSAFGKLQSNLSALRDAASALTSSTTWNQTTGTSSDSASVAVTTDGNNRPGSFSVQVTQLASAQSNVSKIFASTSELVGEGTLHIELGTWGAGNSFTAKPGATAVDISVGPPAKSLAEVRDMVNAANAGITASVLTDASRRTAGVQFGGHRRGQRLSHRCHRHRWQWRRSQRPVGAGLRSIGRRDHDVAGAVGRQCGRAGQRRPGHVEHQHADQSGRGHDADAGSRHRTRRCR